MRRLRTYVCKIRIVDDRGILLFNGYEVASYQVGWYYFMRNASAVETNQCRSMYVRYRNRYKYNKEDDCMSPLRLFSTFEQTLTFYRGLECLYFNTNRTKIVRLFREVF